MEASSPPPPQPLQSTVSVLTNQPHITTVDSFPNQPPNPTAQNPSPPLSTGLTVDDNLNTKKKIKKIKKKRVFRYGSASLPSSSPSSCSSSSSAASSSFLSTKSVVLRRRNPRALLGTPRGSEGNVDAIALPLGMSVAAVFALVLETKDAPGDRMSVDHLSTIFTSAIRESLVNQVFGDKFNCFVRNFEKSFGSTLMTLRSINESHIKKGGHHISNLNVEGSTSAVTLNERGCTSSCSIEDFLNVKGSTSDLTLNERGCTSSSGIEDFQSEAPLQTFVSHEQLNTIDEIKENLITDSFSQELALLEQTNQVACVSPSTSSSVIGRQSVVSNFQKSVIEQARSNDLKTLELGLTMKRLKMKETQLALSFDLNHLERSKLAMGISKASFKAEKFKNQLEDMRQSELLRKCIDCLVAGLLIMSASLCYGAYVFSYQRITEATESCTASPTESKPWWIPNPMTSFNSGLHTLRCQVQVLSRKLFGLLMIVFIAYLLIQRSATATQTMPVTFMILLLGIACGFAGKFCVDTVGGSGYHWLVYWETLCLLHFFCNVCTSTLFLILHGPVKVSQGTKGTAIFPYWIRRFLFYAILLLFLPLFCGLMPFASPGEWKDHFSLLVTDYLSITGG